MPLRRVPGRLTRKARLGAILAAAVVTGSSGLLLVTSATANAQAAAPSVAVRVSGDESAVVSGRTARASAKVRIERRTVVGWAFVKRTRSHGHRYSTSLVVPAGSSQTFRVTSDHRSRKFVVAMPERKAPGGTTTTPTTPAAPTKAPSAPTQYDDCGARPVKADGSLWSCTFHDDFDGTTLDGSKWIPQTVFATGGSTETYACYRDDPANVNVANGVLNLTLLRLDQPAPCAIPGLAPTRYQSGMVSTWHRFSQQYGRFEARVKNTASAYPGLGEGFWMWPDDRVPSSEKWPNAGEIDIAETFSVHPDSVVSTLHYSEDANGMRLGVNYNVCSAKRGEWNTYALEWTSTRMEFFVNGRSCFVNTSGDAAFQKPYIIDLTQGIGPAPMGNSPVEQTPIPATFKVDYVHVWQ
jgi:beta-glucanase (GH16 family)